MGKRMSRILSILLVSALVVSTGNVARAEEIKETEAEVLAEQEVPEAEDEAVPEVEEPEAEDEAVPEVEEPEIEEAAAMAEESKFESAPAAGETMDELLADPGLQKFLAGSTTEPLINDVYINSVNTQAEARKIENDPSIVRASAIGYYLDEPFVSKAVKLPKGTLLIAAYGIESSESASYVGVYKDRQLTKPVGRELYVSKSSTTANTTIVDIPSTGTYYIGVKAAISRSDHLPNAIALGLCSFSGADRTITNNKEFLVGQKANGTVNYFKFKAKYTGYITTGTNEEAQSVTVTLCNSKKKALSGATSARQTPTYGVKKGQTYYIKLRNPNLNSYGYYIFKLNNKKITKKSNTSKSKAITLKKNKTVQGTIEAGSSKADWYKFTLTGSKSVNIAVNGGSNDELKFTVYDGGRVIGTRRGYNNFKGNLKSAGKWSRGTYYVKVSRGNSKSSGYYTMKLK